MGGKKKKSLSNKLAKMSDEERARYLQHRAEVEEEARRRKEQLIATFMKKKIKKEEAFSRLNMAKINQNWHQILRKIKVKEMKDEVMHLKRSIERVVEYKNRRISKLMDSLEEAEEQYLNNFNSHSTHLDNIIENQNEYIEKLQSQYQEELDDFLDQAREEDNSIKEHADSEAAYLKTVIYGQETQAVKGLRESWEYYSKRLYEVEYNNRAKLKGLCKTRGETESAIWRQILQVVRLYVQRTDVRRSHLQELRRMDAESAEEIRKKEDRIIKEEELIKILNINYEDLLKIKTDKVKSLEAEESLLNVQFLKIRKTLKIQLALDEKQLRFLTATSNEALDLLNHLLTKGKHLLALSNTCQKFQTEREKVSKWLPILDLEVDVSEQSVSDKDAIFEEITVKGNGLTDDEKLIKQALERGLSLPQIKHEMSSQPEKPSTSSLKPRPKTSIPSRLSIKSAASVTDLDLLPTPDSKVIPIEEVKIEVKKPDEHQQLPSQSATYEESESIKNNFLDECYQSLEKMENFWIGYNKTEIDVMELRQEKVSLDKENKQLRGLIRAVLEAAALTKSIPDSRVSTRVQSKRRSAYSAPLHRIVFN